MYRTTGQRVFGIAQMHPLLRPGLVGCWIGGGSGLTWFDMSGYGRHGVLTNGPLWTLGEGDKRSALSFDGVDDYVSMGTLPDLAVFSLAVRAKRNTITGAYDTLLGFRASYAALILYESGNIDLTESSAGGSTASWTGVWTDKTMWHSLAYSQTASGSGSTATLYFDGVSFGDRTATTNTLNALTIGDFITNFTNDFFGLIDSVFLYNRVLSQAEIVLLASIN